MNTIYKIYTYLFTFKVDGKNLTKLINDYTFSEAVECFLSEYGINTDIEKVEKVGEKELDIYTS